jgi:hypothetical protein
MFLRWEKNRFICMLVKRTGSEEKIMLHEKKKEELA